MKKFILIALIIGLLIPVLAQIKEFYYLSGILLLGIVFFAIKKKTINIIDILILLLMTIPLHSLRLGTEEHFIRLSEVVFIPLFIWYIFSKFLNKSNEPFTIRKEFILLGIYLIINIISTKNSLYPAISIKRIIILSYLFLFTYIVSEIVYKKEYLEKIIKATIIISALSAIIAVFQSIFPQLLLFYPVPLGKAFGITLYRAGVGWHDPNYYALYLTMNAVLTLSILLSKNAKKYRFLLLCFVLQVMGIFATFSRTAMISLVLVSLYLLIRYGRKPLAYTMISLIIIGAILTTISVGFLYKKNPFMASLLYRVSEQETLENQPTLIAGHRYAAFIANINMFKHHPFIGVGPFMAMYNFDRYKPFGYDYPQDWLASHNQYLQLLSEKGIFGFIVFLLFIMIVLMNIKKSMKIIYDKDMETYLIGLSSGIFVYLVSSLVLETSHELQFWFTVGLSLAILKLLEKESNNA